MGHVEGLGDGLAELPASGEGREAQGGRVVLVQQAQQDKHQDLIMGITLLNLEVVEEKQVLIQLTMLY